VTSPDVVLLDEPLANLDRHLKQEMEETFREFHMRSGATMIYVTHDQSEAMALATDVAVMAEGKLLQMAAPADIYARPEGRLVGGLVGQGAILSLAVPLSLPRQLDWTMLSPIFARVGNGAGDAQDKADVLVRPQDVIVGAEGVAATVETALFEGERYAVRLRLDDGQMLRAYSRNAVQPGDRLSVAIRAGWQL
jgi:iron(III) transport system ATP-binding protein